MTSERSQGLSASCIAKLLLMGQRFRKAGCFEAMKNAQIIHNMPSMIGKWSLILPMMSMCVSHEEIRWVCAWLIDALANTDLAQSPLVQDVKCATQRTVPLILCATKMKLALVRKCQIHVSCTMPAGNANKSQFLDILHSPK